MKERILEQTEAVDDPTWSSVVVREKDDQDDDDEMSMIDGADVDVIVNIVFD